MVTFLAFPILSLLVMIQSAIASRINLIQGSTDLLMLVLIAWALHPRVKTAWRWGLIGGVLATFATSTPPLVTTASYLAVTAFALLIKRRVWQTPVLAMVAVTLIGSLIRLGLDWGIVWISGTPLPLDQSFFRVILPGMLLNLFLSVPIYTMIFDLAERLHPEELEV